MSLNFEFYIVVHVHVHVHLLLSLFSNSKAKCLISDRFNNLWTFEFCMVFVFRLIEGSFSFIKINE